MPPLISSRLVVFGWVLAVIAGGGATLVGAAPGRAGPRVDLPDDLELVVAAASPLVRYPIMGCFDDRRRLFIGDSAGLNLRAKELQEQLPARVLMLEDTDGDGIFDRSTVYADKLTFPQGACWLNGSLYVASPPGIWKFTDTKGDGVADQREMIVGGFEFDGNAADVHGPFLHPTNGRIYWCHGRKGHKIVQKDGTLVHEGKASGVWSCRPDGADVQWHALGCMDNPVEIDFTPEGQMVGVVNLYYNQPRGDTLVHWLYGGVYERPDLLNVIAELPRTLEQMPVVHNFGHVAVSGFTRYRSGGLNPAWRNDLFVTFFNTQKLVRVTLTGEGATYRATEHEFLKLHDPDAHFTDVIEDPGDGSLVILDTGGWFRLGCPSSIAEKPDFRGSVYRVRKKVAAGATAESGRGLSVAAATGASGRVVAAAQPRVGASGTAAANVTEPVSAASLRAVGDPFGRLRALEALALSKKILPGQRAALREILDGPLEPTLEHAAMFAAMATRAFDLDELRQAKGATLLRRLLVVLQRTTTTAEGNDVIFFTAKARIDSADADLARTALGIVAQHPRGLERCYEDLNAELAGGQVSEGRVKALTELVGRDLRKPGAKSLMTAMLTHAAPRWRETGWRLLASQAGTVSDEAWLAPLSTSLATASKGAGGEELLLVMDAIGKVASTHFDQALQALADDASRSSPIRMRALTALTRSNEPVSAVAFAYLLTVAKNESSTVARLDAARILGRSRLAKAQWVTMAPLLATAGPLEIAEYFKSGRRLDGPTAQLWAESFVQSPVLSSIPESAIRGTFSNLSLETYERVLGPTVRAAAAGQDGKKRQLTLLAAAAGKGRASEGKAVFAASACLACHRAGELGRSLGPDLSQIGRIRGPRDLLESILLPSATIARDFETHVVETRDGQSYLGAVRRDAVDGLVLVDAAGEEKKIPHAEIVGHTTLPTSLMPSGLEQAFTEQQLLDLTAWLVSLK